jgi:hypothetical protein
LAALDAVVLQGLAAGALADGCKLRSSMSLEARLGATIKCRGAALSYLDVYTYLYRAISFGEIHTSSALEFHAVYGEDHFGFKVTPLSTLDVTTLIALSVRLACGAAVDVFEVLGTDSGAMARRSSSLDSLLQRSVAEMAQQLDASSSPEIQRALDVIRRRE